MSLDEGGSTFPALPLISFREISRERRIRLCRAARVRPLGGRKRE
jgi:hypothetical protein